MSSTLEMVGDRHLRDDVSGSLLQVSSPEDIPYLGYWKCTWVNSHCAHQMHPEVHLKEHLNSRVSDPRRTHSISARFDLNTHW